MDDSLTRHRALASATRSRVLAVLRASDGGLSIRDVAAALALHPSSAREQLQLLERAGLVSAATAPPAGRGRPALRYVARREPGGSGQPVAAAYRELATVLADQLSRAPDAREAAVEAGERWGRGLVQAGHAADEQEPVARLVRLLDDAGFAPERPARDAPSLRLRGCPFGSLARDRADVVCGVHLGLMRGALRMLDAPVDVRAIEPFVAPDLCLAHLGGWTDG